MSWDLIAMSFPPGIRDISEVPSDFKKSPVGLSAEIQNTILTFPGARVSGEGMVTIENDGYAIEISFGEEPHCNCVMFYVYGNGLSAVKVIQEIGVRLSVRIWDINGAQFLDCATDPTGGFESYKTYRDHVVKKEGADGKS